MDVTKKMCAKHIMLRSTYCTKQRMILETSEYNYNAIILIIQIQFREYNNKKYFEVLTFSM